MLGKVGASTCAMKQPYCVPPTLTVTGDTLPAGVSGVIQLCYKCAPSVKAVYEAQGHTGLALASLANLNAHSHGQQADRLASSTSAAHDARPCALAQPDCKPGTFRLRDFRDDTSSFELWVCCVCFHDVVSSLREQGRWVRVGEAINQPDVRWLK